MKTTLNANTTSLSQHGESFEYDVLVIGSGLAGLYYSLQLLKLQPKANIALISKAEINECNSRYAQGGIAAAIDPKDSPDAHIQDTLLAGDALCYIPAVETIIRQAPEAIKELMSYSINFSQNNTGDFQLAQ